MKILLIHTFYQQKGGEDTVFANEHDLLKKNNAVRALTFMNKKGWRGLLQFVFSLWNLSSARRLKEEIRDFRPDVIHMHNWHFAAGPLLVRVARRRNVPVVLTLHNYRLLCPSATLVHNEMLFLSSTSETFPWTAVRNKVYRNSRLQTFWLAFVVWFHKKIGTWKMVDRYLVLTKFAKDQMVDSNFGVAAERFTVKPNFTSAARPAAVARQDHFLFAGRLSEEKGIAVLLKAFSGSDAVIHIAGSGPLLLEVLTAAKRRQNIRYLGDLSKDQILTEMQSCSALIFPSIWYEGMPMTLLEAFATGTPVLASDIGAMSSMIRDDYNGLHFKAGDDGSLSNTIKKWQFLIPKEEKKQYSKNALGKYLASYTPDKNLELLMNIYAAVLSQNGDSELPQILKGPSSLTDNHAEIINQYQH